MVIGVPCEIKEHEYRVGITPGGVRELRRDGHRVLVEKSAGIGSGYSDEDYAKEGTEVSNKNAVFKNSELIVKVKEPLSSEFKFFRKGQSLFTFLHLAPNPELVKILLQKHIAAFGYETLEVNSTLPLLEPMSEIAGKMAPLMAAYYQQKIHGGGGILLTGAHDIAPANVLVLGAGTVGLNAVKIAFNNGARVTVLNRGMEKLREIERIYNGHVKTLTVTDEHIKTEVPQADIVIGAVLVTGARAPRLIPRDLVAKMQKGSVIVDVAVDQGGCVETTRPTTHSNPVYSVNGIIHYAVTNMPGAYPKTSTIALTNRTIPYIKTLARDGIEEALKKDEALKSALNIFRGDIFHKGLAESLSA
jgi:alanine dehydrogenase